MLHCRQPCVSTIGRRGAVDFDAFGIHRSAKEWHVIFPTDNGPHSTNFGLYHWESRSITIAPDQPLTGSRHKLSMLSEILPIRVEKEHRAIERPTFPLDCANH